MAEYAVFIQGLSDAVDEIGQLSDRVRIAAHRAVNYATRKAKTESSRMMREQIAWSASYVNDKLVMKLANGDELEASIRTEFRPTSLARFAVGSKRPWEYAKRLHVGAARYADTNGKMLFVPLKAGKGPITEDNFNLGLAVRLKEGETIRGKYRVKPIGKGLYLLYGPSSAQVFYSVAEDVIPDVSGWLDQEFARQMNRKDL